MVFKIEMKNMYHTDSLLNCTSRVSESL